MPSGNPLWPEFWSLTELEALRSELPAPKWNAQYQQAPTAEEGALVRMVEYLGRKSCHPVTLSYSHGTQHFKPRGPIILLALMGRVLAPDDEGRDRPSIFFLVHIESDWSF